MRQRIKCKVFVIRVWCVCVCRNVLLFFKRMRNSCVLLWLYIYNMHSHTIRGIRKRKEVTARRRRKTGTTMEWGRIHWARTFVYYVKSIRPGLSSFPCVNDMAWARLSSWISHFLLIRLLFWSPVNSQVNYCKQFRHWLFLRFLRIRSLKSVCYCC